MPGVPPSGQGWLRDQPDFRDFTPATPGVREALERLKRRRTTRGAKPAAAVDFSEYLAPAPPAADRMTVVDTALSLVAYFERRATGRLLEGSTLFLDYNARRLAATPAGGGVSLRTALKALARFGCPPRQYEPSPSADGRPYEPTPFDYGFGRESAGLQYVRLDGPGRSGSEILRTVKAFVAAGFACACGCSLGSAPAVDGDIPFPTKADAIEGGTGLVVVGYDDDRRIRSSHGALLVRTSFGSAFGRGGVGRLPYRFVEEGLACDFWTLLKSDWSATAEFEQPALNSASK
jgi:C1A family cysteine protease